MKKQKFNYLQKISKKNSIIEYDSFKISLFLPEMSQNFLNQHSKNTY